MPDKSTWWEYFTHSVVAVTYSAVHASTKAMTSAKVLHGISQSMNPLCMEIKQRARTTDVARTVQTAGNCNATALNESKAACITCVTARSRSPADCVIRVRVATTNMSCRVCGRAHYRAC